MKLFRKKQDDEFLLLSETDEEFGKSTDLNPDVLTPEEVLNIGTGAEETVTHTGALDSLKKRLIHTEEAEPTSEKSSLMDKCLPYFVDDNGEDLSYNDEPLYELQSVADILKADSEESIKRLSEKYGITFVKEEKEEPVKPFEIKEETPPEPPKEKPDPVTEEKKPLKVISDIDGSTSSFDKITTPPETSQTVTFTPVSSHTSKTHIEVTTKTQQIDLTGELVKLPEEIPQEKSNSVKLEENEFDEYVPETEPTSRKEIGKLVREFSLSKRNHFIATCLSFFFAILICLAKIPFISSMLIEHTTIGMTVLSSIAGIIILINSDMFLSFGKLFNKKSGADCAAGLASITTTIYTVLAIINGEIITDMLIVLSVILSFRSLFCFKKASYMLSNLKIAGSTTDKKTVKLISDQAVTFSMAKDSIEGDTLIACSQKAENTTDFMKYSTFGNFFSGRMPVINAVSLFLSLISGIACALYFDGLVYGMYAASAVQCFSALPILFFIDTLPLHSAAKKLNRMGAMIAGKAGAEQVEKANGAVLTATDLFPSGTVTLHQMKVLSENSLDDTLIRAACLTEYMNSPLAPIFKTIIKSGNITTLPDTDTVKYEDRLGISGWVDNRLLFIGNRTLMTTHGIEVPPLEVDRKILRQGYFPVYVATREKACALLIIQYRVDRNVAKELRRLTASGVTLLVNSSDPNLTEEMVCDYLGLYDDSVKIMSAAGCYMHNNVSAPIKTASAPAVFKSKNISLAAILNCAAKIKRSNILLTVCYVISAVLGAIIFAYTSFGGAASLISDTVILIYVLVSTILTYLIYLSQSI